MMQSKEKITRANAMDIIRRFAKEYRKTLGCILRPSAVVDAFPSGRCAEHNGRR